MGKRIEQRECVSQNRTKRRNDRPDRLHTPESTTESDITTASSDLPPTRMSSRHRSP